MDKVP